MGEDGGMGVLEMGVGSEAVLGGGWMGDVNVGSDERYRSEVVMPRCGNVHTDICCRSYGVICIS